MLQFLKFLVAVVATVVDMAFRANPHSAVPVRSKVVPISKRRV